MRYCRPWYRTLASVGTSALSLPEPRSLSPRRIPRHHGSLTLLQNVNILPDKFYLLWAQVTFKGTLGEFHNFWQHCTNYIMSI